MSEVVRDSTSKLSDDDLKAIATYIKDVDGGPNPPPPPAPPKDKKMSAGEAIFADSCSACHQADGSGVPRMFPPLAGNANVQSRDPTTIIRVILQGAQTAPTDKAPTAFSMPAFDWKLDDGQIAAVASYVRNTWGNSAPPVGPDQVGSLRKAVRQGHATQ
jgi:mono/diheme cytochrome c family protein